jgi:hypothetical protein
MGADEERRRAERKELKTTVMLVAIVVVFLACNTLAFVVNILENIGYEDALYGTLVMYNNLLVRILNIAWEIRENYTCSTNMSAVCIGSSICIPP